MKYVINTWLGRSTPACVMMSGDRHVKRHLEWNVRSTEFTRKEADGHGVTVSVLSLIMAKGKLA